MTTLSALEISEVISAISTSVSKDSQQLTSEQLRPQGSPKRKKLRVLSAGTAGSWDGMPGMAERGGGRMRVNWIKQKPVIYTIHLSEITVGAEVVNLDETETIWKFVTPSLCPH